MSGAVKLSIGEVRKALWHLRNGGPAQLREWTKRRSYEHRTGALHHGDLSDVEKSIGIRLPDTLVSKGYTQRKSFTVAVILDDFSAKAWSPEWNCVFIKPNTWEEELATVEFDFLFVESAWAGNGKAWQYHLTGPTAPRPAFVDMVEAFQTRNIPTVFWNKEDPPHFEDFLDTAKLFDFVFTSDERMISRYEQELGHGRIYALSFAAQPAFHNPVRPLSQPRRDVAFAGMYFAHKFPERREQMDIVLGGAAMVAPRLESGFDIFSRQLGGDEKYQFPDPFNKHVVGSLPYEKMLTAHKYYNVFLNVNSVVDSPSMCARRIFEITAAGAAVVSAPSTAISNFFAPNEVIEVADQESAAHAIRSLTRSPELRDRTVHLGQRRIWSEHTYAHRARSVAEKIGLTEEQPYPLSMASRPSVSVVVSTIRPQQIHHIIHTVAKQWGVQAQLILVAHRFSVDERDFQTQMTVAGIENYKLIQAGEELSLGDCLNQAVALCDGDFITKMDDDDLYGQHYLFDQVAALRYSGASVVGKQTHYMYLGQSDATLLRFAEREHRFTNLVMGPTMLGHSEVFKANPFESRSRGEDTQFLRDVANGGGTIYSADRFNFLQMRSGDGNNHTWNLSDAELTATGTIQWFGKNDSHIFF
ncbi:glycosyltransferase family protein [Glutamicibacter uratoxydans]|uniref:glycosyltransferase family protein n=1 Tax=Glutamicibacter uratoxydans TaxID=43667 RepID=UPI003D6E3073